MSTAIGVAISTTGQEHRLGMLLDSYRAWDKHLPEGSSLLVTVDGDQSAVHRVAETLRRHTCGVYRVGRPSRSGDMDENHRLGVAANKNTGLELLMAQDQIGHLFLCDDDTWPLSQSAIMLHMATGSAHSMVCWGKHRLVDTVSGDVERFAEWSWPRGAVLYQTRQVVERVGGMDERFGKGGHEHVEYSRRIYQHGITPALYLSPIAHAQDKGMGARTYWHAEDMARANEGLATLISRRRRITTIERTDVDYRNMEYVLNARDGDTNFVPYHASQWGRSSATLYHSR